MRSPPAPSVLLGHLSTHCPLKHQHLKFNSEMEHDTTDEILRRNRSEQSADVKKILREHIMSRHPPHERAPSVAKAGFRVPVSEGLSPQTSTDSKKALRRTVSEPTLKWKQRKMMGARPNPLQRKISAPPAVRHRSNTGADSPCSSAPVSESSSCDSLLTDSATSLIQETGPPSLPHFSPLFRPLDLGTTLSQCLQPVLVLNQSTGHLHHQYVALPDLSSVPVPPQCPLSALRGRDGLTLGSHRPVKRSRSEPTPYSPSPLLLSPTHPHSPLLLTPGHAPSQNLWTRSGLDRYKSNTPLSKIPSEDSDLDETRSRSSSGPGSDPGLDPGLDPGSVYGPGCGSDQSRRPSVDSVYGSESNASSRESLLDTPPALSQKLQRPSASQDSPRVSAQLWAHLPLGRTRSLPAPTSISPHITPLRFTTGLAYDAQMQRHECSCRNWTRHHEHPGRTEAVWTRLTQSGLRGHCELREMLKVQRKQSSKQRVAIFKNLKSETSLEFCLIHSTCGHS